MDIKNVKQRTKLIIANQKNLLATFIFIGCVMTIIQAIPQLFGSQSLSGLLEMVIMVLLLPFGHGYIVASLKEVNNKDDQIHYENEGLVGLHRFKDLFSTYFVYNLIIGAIGFIFVLMTIFFVMFIFRGDMNSVLYAAQSFSSSQDLEAYMQLIPSAVIGIILLMSILMFIIYVWYQLTYCMTPYLLEKYGLKNTKAMKQSRMMMKGHKWEYFKLVFSYVGWMILSLIATAVLATIIAVIIPINFIASLLASLLGVVISSYVYNMSINCAQALFFEELDYVMKKKDESYE